MQKRNIKFAEEARGERAACRALMESVDEAAVRDKRCLLLWHQGCSPEALSPVLSFLREKAGERGEVLLEHVERLTVG